MTNTDVTVIYFWKIKSSKVGFALLRMALDRGALRGIKGVRFAKMLGSGKGETFTPRDADANRWGALIVIDGANLEMLDNSKLINRWRANSISEVRYLLDPISSHGLWAKVNPFAYATTQTDGEVIAITRARIKWFQNFRFWRAVPPVTQSLHSSPGLINTIGIGEAPIGLQGTFSHWRTGADLRNFAYKGAAHQDAIAATERHQWYAEELFARFAVRDIRG
ncbi:MAG: spheroidene monooxygenase [Actinomycetota bacterium]